jgi:hypothetical protein
LILFGRGGKSPNRDTGYTAMGVPFAKIGELAGGPLLGLRRHGTEAIRIAWLSQIVGDGLNYIHV